LLLFMGRRANGTSAVCLLAGLDDAPEGIEAGGGAEDACIATALGVDGEGGGALDAEEKVRPVERL